MTPYEPGQTLAPYEDSSPLIAGDHGTAPTHAGAVSILERSDAQHFAAFEHDLVSRLGSQAHLAKPIIAAAQAVLKEVPEPEDGHGVFQTLGPFAQKLAEQHLAPVMIRVAMSAAIEYLADLVDSAPSGDDYRAQDDRDRAETRAALQRLWGQNYLHNVRALRQFVNTALPPPVADAIWEGRDQNGRAIANHASVIRWLFDLMTKGASMNPDTGQPAPATGPLTPLEMEEYDRIAKMVGNPYSNYWKGEQSAHLQRRFGELAVKKERSK